MMFLPYLGTGAMGLLRSTLPTVINKLPSTLLRNEVKKPKRRKVVGSQRTPDKDYDYSVEDVPIPRPDKLPFSYKVGGGLLAADLATRDPMGILGNNNNANAMPPQLPILPDSLEPPVTTPRFEQVLFPGISGQATNKELINAAILRGSLELLKPKQPGENFASQAARALEAGTSVNEQTTGVYATAQEALQAAKAAGFKNIKVYAKGKGFGYTGEVGGFDDYLGGKTESEEGDSSEETGLQVLSKEEYNKAVALIYEDFPDATPQQIMDTLNKNGFTYEG
jgi:hypothetical protein